MGQARRQAAVIPYRVRNGRLEVAAITSASNHDWIVPKGGVEEGERPWEAAAREAEEEAGLLGVVDRTPLGRCHSSNGNGGAIDVYVLYVAAVLDHWPEEQIRQRRWMSVPDAVACLRPEFRPFIAALEDLMRGPRLQPNIGRAGVT
jgi:8-oxo-dGTP pyrophosphatase MutT (NUDIX family)